jgi:hypothetical protein
MRKQKMIDYPLTLPLDAAALVAEIVKTRTVQTRKAEFAHAGWNVQGYIQKVTLGDPQPRMAAGDADEDAAFPQVMETLLSIEGDLDAYQHEGVLLSAESDDQAQEEAGSILVVLGVISAILQAIQLWRNRNKEGLEGTES